MSGSFISAILSSCFRILAFLSTSFKRSELHFSPLTLGLFMVTLRPEHQHRTLQSKHNIIRQTSFFLTFISFQVGDRHVHTIFNVDVGITFNFYFISKNKFLNIFRKMTREVTAVWRRTSWDKHRVWPTSASTVLRSGHVSQFSFLRHWIQNIPYASY